jgi:hypothetical protein
MILNQTDYSVVVKHRAPPPKSWRWEIYRAGRRNPIEQSSVYFQTMTMASLAGKKALKQLLDKLHSQPLRWPLCNGGRPPADRDRGDRAATPADTAADPCRPNRRRPRQGRPRRSERRRRNRSPPQKRPDIYASARQALRGGQPRLATRRAKPDYAHGRGAA